MIKQTPNVTVINSTDGGAKIKGTVFEPLENVIEKYCRTSMPNRLDLLLKESYQDIDRQRENKLNRLRCEFKKHIDIFRALDQLTVERKSICQVAAL